MTANEIRDYELQIHPDDRAQVWVLREIAAQLAELNALLHLLSKKFAGL